MSKIILITGASSGIGASIAKLLSQKGYIVYGTSRNPKVKPLNFNLVELDVKLPKTIDMAIGNIIEKHGRIDVLVNNAGVGITGPLEQTPLDKVKSAFDTNLYGVLNVCKGALPYMRKQKSGIIINISSIAAYMGLPYRGVYCATKSAVRIITESLSSELKPFGICVVDVAPGDFATNIANGRYHTPVYPDSDYKDQYERILKQIDQDVENGQDSIKMARAVYSIINSKSPKLHYKVGSFIQKFSVVLKSILPDRIYEKILIKHYKL